jgi:ABC-type branched-subunit amino acid transport system substrate-binding protein
LLSPRNRSGVWHGRSAAFLVLAVLGIILSNAVHPLIVNAGFAENVPLTAAQIHGRELYRQGTSRGANVAALLQNATKVSARNFACANCHGVEGDGQSEGGLRAPALDWDSLSTPRDAGLASHNRAAYTTSSVRRAITTGVDPAGLQLSPAMPQFQLNDSQIDDLIAYLRIVGREADADPGVNASSVRIGTLLPMTGPLAPIGNDVATVLRAYFSQINDAGGIYGRKIELVVSDTTGQAEPTLVALKEQIEQHQVFAIAAPYIPSSLHLDDELALSGLPLVAPVSFKSDSNLFERYRFDILPGFADQARCLVRFFQSQEGRSRDVKESAVNAALSPRPQHAVVIYGDGIFDHDAYLGFSAEAKQSGMAPVQELKYGNALFEADAGEFLLSTKPDVVFYFGAENGLKVLIHVAANHQLSTQFLTTSAMAGSLAAGASPDVANRVWLAQPLTMETTSHSGLTQILKATAIPSANPTFKAIAYAAADVLSEALKRSGRKLSRARLTVSLQSLRNFETDILPPITFSARDHLGAKGCAINHIDQPPARQAD